MHHYGPQYGYSYAMPHPPPPDPRAPERPDGISPFPRWPVWYGPAAFGCGIAAATVLGAIVGAVSGGKLGTTAGLILTLVLDAAFVAIAVLFASRTERPRPAHFGLRRAPFWRTVGWAALGWGCYFVVSAVYGSLVKDRHKQSILTEVKSDKGTALLLLLAFLAIVVAPAAEEFFFRGFFYRALRSRMSVLVAAVLDGLLFGAIHYEGPDSATLLPVLALLGFTFCLVYEKTGTLFATMTLHALNNTLAYGVSSHEWGIALAFAVPMVTACAVLPRVLGSGLPARAVRAPARA